LYSMLIGSIFIYVGVIFYQIHGLSSFSCIFRVWLLGIGFFLVFGALFAKSFKVWRLWSSNLTKQVSISNLQLFGLVAGFVSIEIILLIIYTSVGAPDYVIIEMDKYRPSMNQEHCVNNEAGTILLGIMTAFGFLFMGFGLFLAWITRKVPFLAFNESKIILFSMYNVTFFSIIAVIIISNANKIDPEPLLIIRSICLLLSAFITVCISIGNKFWLLLHGKTVKSKSTVTVTTRWNSRGEGSSPAGSGADNADDMVLRSEFDLLQKEILELKKRNDELKEQISNIPVT